MISLLIAIFGKDKIPNSLRYALLAFGVSMLAYKLYLFRKVQREIKEAQAIQQVIEQRVAKGEAPPTTPPTVIEAKPQPISA